MNSEDNGAFEPRLFSDYGDEHREEAEESSNLADDINHIPEVEVLDLLSSDLSGINGSYKMWKEKSLQELRTAMSFNVTTSNRYNLKVPWRPLHHAPTNYYIQLKSHSLKPIKWSLNIVHGKLGMPVCLHEVEDDEENQFDTLKARCINYLKDMVKGQQEKLRISNDVSILDGIDCCHKAEMMFGVPIIKRTKRKCYLNSLLDIYPKVGILKPGEEEVLKLKVHHELLGIFTLSYKFELEFVSPDAVAKEESPKIPAGTRIPTGIKESPSLDSIPGASMYLGQEQQNEINKAFSFDLDINIPTSLHKMTDSFVHHIDSSFDCGLDTYKDSQEIESITDVGFVKSQSVPEISESDLREKVWQLVPGHH